VARRARTDATIRVADGPGVLSVSSLVEDYQGITGLCLSLPSIVGRNGVEQIVRIPLALEEAAALQHSAAVLRESLGSLGPIMAPSG